MELRIDHYSARTLRSPARPRPRAAGWLHFHLCINRSQLCVRCRCLHVSHIICRGCPCAVWPLLRGSIDSLSPSGLAIPLCARC
eukprot:scaffold54202_cov85-Phaeocystis_antarctica.AAC.2